MRWSIVNAIIGCGLAGLFLILTVFVLVAFHQSEEAEPPPADRNGVELVFRV